ncbi:proline-rich transmembrane protein 1-like [Ptychodera flava]|uniref:proline-rich transmembrane protein 1-like n=1 Tax=Ptychodera flava TaxID=63121 RepID=UPI00396A9B72
MSYDETERHNLLGPQDKRVQFVDQDSPSIPPPSYPGPAITEQPSPARFTYGQPLPAWRIPDDHFIMALVTTILCFWPIGMFALWKSREVYKASARGDLEGAWLASNSARMLSWATLIVGLILFVIVIIVVIAADIDLD